MKHLIEIGGVQIITWFELITFVFWLTGNFLITKIAAKYLRTKYYYVGLFSYVWFAAYWLTAKHFTGYFFTDDEVSLTGKIGAAVFWFFVFWFSSYLIAIANGLILLLRRGKGALLAKADKIVGLNREPHIVNPPENGR